MLSDTYKDLEFIGNGRFAHVFSAKDSTNDDRVAVKEIKLEYQGVLEYKRIYRELDILKHLHSHYSLKLINVYKEVIDGRLMTVQLILPLMDFSLKMVMEMYDIVYDQIIKIMYQVLLALKYLYGAGIIHRDLKPSNIGINENMDLRLLDFGLAREVNGDMTEYVVTRWYRPVEVFCGPDYTTAVDMWSAGCIYAELFTKNVLFKGSSPNDQVTKIFQITGFPDEEMLSSIHNENVILGLKIYEALSSKTNLLETHIRPEIENFISTSGGDQECSNNVVKLICRMLDLNPSHRPTPDKALLDPLFVHHKAIVCRYPEDDVPVKYSFSRNLSDETDDSMQRLLIESIDNFSA